MQEPFAASTRPLSSRMPGVIGLLCALVIACGGAGAGHEPGASRQAPRSELPQAEAPPLTEDQVLLVAGQNAFALDLFARLRSLGPGNLFVSPLSISTALTMTFAGARGETAAEMSDVLALRLPAATLHQAAAGLDQHLRVSAEREGLRLAAANRLWGQIGMGFLPAFRRVTRDHYGAELTELDFAADAESARTIINGWVQEQTAGMIRDLIAPDMLGEATSLVLTNAIYFKGSWKHRFDAQATRKAPFYLSDSEQVSVPMMSQEADFGHADHGDLQVLELPYGRGALSMIILLPRSASGLADLERNLTEATLSAWTADLGVEAVQVTLPRFTMTYEAGLGDVLQTMGMERAFTHGADFSGMNGRTDLLLSAVIHKAFVEVNEEGTEAAAATAVIVDVDSVEPTPPQFRADRPFVFLIRHRATGSILFLGRLADPRG
jgi:serpin B